MEKLHELEQIYRWQSRMVADIYYYILHVVRTLSLYLSLYVYVCTFVSECV